MLKAKMLVPKDKYMCSYQLEEFETKKDILSTDPIVLSGIEVVLSNNGVITFVKDKLISNFDTYKFGWSKLGEYSRSPKCTFYSKDGKLLCIIEEDKNYIYIAPEIEVATLNRTDTSYNSETQEYKEEIHKTLFDDSNIELIIYRYN